MDWTNKKKGKPPTAEHNRFTEAAEEMDIEVERQSSNSPELNKCDLGMWWCLNAAVQKRYKEFVPRMKKKELLDKLWEVIVEEWDKMEPEGLFSIAGHKLDVAKAIVQIDGRKLKKEPHAHARQRTKDAIAAARGAVVGPRSA